VWHICPTANKVLDKVDCGEGLEGKRGGVGRKGQGVTPNDRAKFSCRDQKRIKEVAQKMVRMRLWSTQ